MRGYLVLFVLFLLVVSPVSAYYKSGTAKLISPVDSPYPEAHTNEYAFPPQGKYYEGKKIPYEATAEYHSPIIFVHGFMGAVATDERGVELWPGVPLRNRDKLKIADDGKSQEVEGSKIIAASPMRMVLVVDIYQNFYTFMDRGSPYTYRGKSGKYGWVDRSYFDFAYDFRQSTEDHVKDLDKFVNTVRTKTKSDKVVLIGHSMGGLVIRNYAAKHSKKVRSLIFLSVPHHGAPKAYFALTEGYNFGVPQALASNREVWGFAYNWPGAYQLMPDFPFYDEGGTTMKLEDTFSGPWISYQQLEKMRFDPRLAADGANEAVLDQVIAESIQVTGIPNKKVLEETFKFREKFNDINLPSNIDLYSINGIGKVTDDSYSASFEDGRVGYREMMTLSSGKVVPVLSDQKTVPVKVMRLTPDTNEEGDETVSFDGLQWDKVPKDRVQTVVEGHGAVPSNPDTHQKLMEIFEEINHDQRDYQLAEHLKFIADNNLAKIRNSDANFGSAEVYADQVKNAREAAKYGSLTDEGLIQRWIKDMNGRLVKGVFGSENEGKVIRINVVVPDAGEYQDEDDWKGYLVVKDLVVIDYGIGTVSPQNYFVTVDSFSTIESISGGSSLKHAYDDGRVKVRGSVIQTLIMQAYNMGQRLLADD